MQPDEATHLHSWVSVCCKANSEAGQVFSIQAEFGAVDTDISLFFLSIWLL